MSGIDQAQNTLDNDWASPSGADRSVSPLNKDIESALEEYECHINPRMELNFRRSRSKAAPMVNTLQNRRSSLQGYQEEQTPATALIASPDIPQSALERIHLPSVGVNLTKDW